MNYHFKRNKMNAQTKKRIALRDQYKIETGLNSWDHIGKYADWLEKQIATEYVNKETAQKFGEHCAKVEQGVRGLWEMRIDDYTRIYAND